ncbi:HAD family hydrolase [Sinimarinibacterium thermocellulolyticum]|uniref:HAD family hydrolase n=1 Tax=Sinimarinibacterium thermocellulolyticum TaxID=3170016 RepID=A0ABV2A8W8_9GAMM
MNLAVFDLDNTLLAGDSDYLWGVFLVENGVVDADHYARSNERFYREYEAGTLDIHAYGAFVLQPLVEHELHVMQELRKRFIDERVVPMVAPGAPALLERHRRAGDTLLITTATNRFVVEPIAALLGVPHLLATEPEIVDGRYTGRLQGTPNFQTGKVARLRAWLDEQRKPRGRITAYSDSHNDLPLLEMADRAVAVDPDPRLRAAAQERGWDVISLR